MGLQISSQIFSSGHIASNTHGAKVALPLPMVSMQAPGPLGVADWQVTFPMEVRRLVWPRLGTSTAALVGSSATVTAVLLRSSTAAALVGFSVATPWTGDE